MIDGILIKQHFDTLEAITGCEIQNKYNIYQKQQGKMKKQIKDKLWVAKEKSGCYSRQCLSNSCREFDIKLKNESKLDQDLVSVRIHKECTCTCYCLNRPKFKVEYTEHQGQEQYLGSIQDDFDCCNFNFSVFGPNNEKLYRIYTGCCQCGICCQGCPCKTCEKVDFKVFDNSGKEIAVIEKRGKNCLKNMLNDADNFGLEFPKSMGWEHRTLMIAAMLLIDFMMFEESQEQNKNGDLNLDI